MTYEQIAATYANWIEYFDTDATMSEAEFNDLSTDDRIALLVEAFGQEAV